MAANKEGEVLKILKILINLLIFSLPMGVLARITVLPNVRIYPYDIIAGLIFLIFVLILLKKKERPENFKLFVLAGSFLVAGFVSLLINISHLEIFSFLTSFAYLVRYAFYLSIIFAFQFIDSAFRKSIPAKLIISGLIFCLLGYIQYFLYNDLRNLYYLGWDEHLYRLFSTFLDPNFAGAFLVLLLTLLTGYIIKPENREGLLRNFFIVSWPIVLISIFFTYSRGAFIMLVVSSFIFMFMIRAYKFLAVAIILFSALLFLFSDKSMEGLNLYRIASIEARLESAANSLKIISENPIIGVGFNAYRYAQIRYGFGEENDVMRSNAGAAADNSYLFVLATTGIIGLLIYLDFWLNVLKRVYLRLKDKNDIYAKTAFASIIGILVNTVFINSIFYAPIMTWIFILIGVTVSRRR